MGRVVVPRKRSQQAFVQYTFTDVSCQIEFGYVCEISKKEKHKATTCICQCLGCFGELKTCTQQFTLGLKNGLERSREAKTHVQHFVSIH